MQDTAGRSIQNLPYALQDHGEIVEPRSNIAMEYANCPCLLFKCLFASQYKIKRYTRASHPSQTLHIELLVHTASICCAVPSWLTAHSCCRPVGMYVPFAVICSPALGWGRSTVRHGPSAVRLIIVLVTWCCCGVALIADIFGHLTRQWET